MKQRRNILTGILGTALVLSLAGCGTDTSVREPEETAAAAEAAETANTETADTNTAAVTTNLSKIDASAWQYNEADDVYYQIGISYCETPADENYETLAVFVPGAYMNAADNGDGTYTCEINTEAEVNGYTAETAPIVMPINTPGYSAQAALSEYKSVTEYTSAGFVYVHAGCRGRDAGAPAGVTDLKAAVRYVRYSDDTVPGDAESIFTFGMSGGGAQSAVMGSTGDSALYEPYLTEIGAVQGVSDAVLGSMCWCPITNLDTADEAYEWMLGVTRDGLSEEEQAISDQLAEAYAEYVNNAGLKDENGTVLTLEESEDGIYQAGTYYEYMKSVIETSLNNFLADTEFPYEASSGGMGGGMPGGHGNGERPSGSHEGAPDFGGQRPDGMGQNNTESGEVNYEAIDDISRTETSGSGLSLSGTYETAQDFIDALNANGEWVTYDAETNTAKITDIASFVKALKNASKSLGAFDQLDAGQGENTLFGYGDGSGAHFDSTLANILSELGNEYADEYLQDLLKTDSAGNTAETRVDMYTPLYYLLESEEGYETSTVAKYWRIRTGLNQGDCALSTEMNLALALENYDSVESVDFETVWGQGHTQAERTGNSSDNFIEWVESCTK
ncbi:MAG: hypothetical protein J5941_00190 [Solobacterium sp.]|nr:hypothetical protein [Solobacterium sp.]